MSHTEQRHTDEEDATRIPLVSIGLPVYNGETFLRGAIESVLDQTFTDFELIICDNASTDGTAAICQHFADTDDRVSYVRLPETVGGHKNHNHAFSLARGKYFRWVAHDDVSDPRLLEQFVQVMENEPDVSLCHSYFGTIDSDGNPIEVFARRRPPMQPRWKLFEQITDLTHTCEEMYGLMRRDQLATTGLVHPYTDSDRTLLAHMALIGRYHEVPEVLFYRRIHAEQSTNVMPGWRQRMLWFGSEYATKTNLPYWWQFSHYIRIIVDTPNDLTTKVRCLAFMPVWLTRNNRWKSMTKDVLLVMRDVFRWVVAIPKRLRG